MTLVYWKALTKSIVFWMGLLLFLLGIALVPFWGTWLSVVTIFVGVLLLFQAKKTSGKGLLESGK
jgi:hypothetical protein